MPTLVGPTDLIVASWQNLRRNTKLYAEFAVWFVFLAVFEWFAMNLLIGLVDDGSYRKLLYGVMSLPLAVVYMGLIAAMTDATSRTIQGKSGDMRYALTHGAHRIIPYIWASLLYVFAVLGGSILLVIPGIFLMIALQFAFSYVVVDDMPGTKAVFASYRLVSGRWWAVAARLVVPSAFFVLIGLFLTSIVELVAGAFLGDPGLFLKAVPTEAAFSSTYSLVAILIPRVVNGITVPLWRASELLLWNDLKKTRPVKE